MHHDSDSLEAPQADFSLVQIISVFILGVGAMVIVLIQPVLLAPLMHTGQLTAGQLGRAATTELIGMAAISFVAAAWLRPERLRLIATAVVLLSMVGNGLTMFSNGGEIIGARLLCGCCSGYFLWLTIGTLVRSPAPARLNGIYVTCVCLLALCFATLCSRWLIPHFGAKGAFSSLLGFEVVMIIAAQLIPKRFDVLSTPKKSSGLPELRAIFSLLAMSAYFGAVTGLWVYIVPLSGELGMPKATIDLAIDLSIVFQILGGLTAAMTGGRLSYFMVLLSCASVALLVVLTLGAGVLTLGAGIGTISYLIVLAALGFVWIMAPAFYLKFVIAAGPSRRAAMFSLTAQLAGNGVGPFLSSLVVSPQHFGGALFVSGGMFVVSLTILIAVHANIKFSQNVLARS
jgi:MFS transporter, DHA1 family, inner membrane transport protein